MQNLLILMIFLSAVLYGPEVQAFGGCEENCGKCHSLDNKEARLILTKIKVPDARIVEIRMSPVKGLWEIVIENRGRKGVIYVGFSKKHIIGGPIFEIDTNLDKTSETLGRPDKPAARYVDTSKIPLDNALVMGDREARYKVIVFTDPDCPYCGKLHNELKKIVSTRRDIAFYIKLMPLKMHPDAYWKSVSIICSNSLQYLEDNFGKKPIPKPDCRTDAIDKNIRLGADLDITGTPTLIMPNGLVVFGAISADKIIDLASNN